MSSASTEVLECWSGLAEESLEKIFETLDRPSLKACRQVNFQWRKVVDSRLAKEHRSAAINWSVQYGHHEKDYVRTRTNFTIWPNYEYNIPAQSGLRVSSGNQVKKLLHEFTGGSEERRLGNPFPSRTLLLSLDDDNWDIVERSALIAKFGTAFGTQFNSMYLYCLGSRFENHFLRVIFYLLSQMPNLEMMFLGDHNRNVSTYSLEYMQRNLLPKLAHLRHLRLENSNEVSKWLLHAYAHQLVSYESGGGFASSTWDPRIPQKFQPFQQLTKLKLFDPTKDVLSSGAFLPKLEQLSLCYDNLVEQVSFSMLLGFADAFRRTLTELYVYFYDYGYDFDTYEGRTRSGNCRLPFIDRYMLFPVLRKFSVMSPTKKKEWVMVKQALNKFPNLLHLQFLNLGWTSTGSSGEIVGRIPAETIQKEKDELRKERCWDICTKLEIITVLNDTRDESLLFKGARPHFEWEDAP